MKKIFRKAITVLGSVALIGATVGAAAAAAYPAPFTSNTAIVVGANAAPSDNIAASSIASNLDAASAGSAVTTLTGATGVTEDEVVLGGVINVSGYKVQTRMTDSKISSLLDEKISWDDGDGSDDYDIHEEIVINGDMSILTSFNDEDLTDVALSNNLALEYRYYFDDAIPISASTAADADDLYLTILGKSYEVTNITDTTITVVTSEEVSVGIGESVTVEGKTYTVDDLSTLSARVNGVTLTIDGSSKKINGLQVEASDVFYNDNFPEQASVTLKIGDDISKTYTSGDEYIGEDEDDPLWTWTFSTPTVSGGYIGVAYNADVDDADDNDAGSSIKYVGATGYLLPENFGEVKLDGLTDVDYEDITVKFTTMNLYDVGTTAESESQPVVVISAESTSAISINSATEETDEIYVYYAKAGSETNISSTNGSIEIFYRDHEGDFTPTNRARFEIDYDLGVTNNLTEVEVASIEVGDSTVSVSVTVASGVTTLSFSNPSDATTVASYDIDLDLGGENVVQAAGEFTQLGTTIDDADVNDIKVRETDVSTKEESIMNYYGMIVAKDDAGGIEGNADADEVVISIPSDQVFASVSVVAGGEVTTTGEAGVMTVMDSAVSTVAGKNLVVVGGSAINSVAAELLGGAYSEAAFTSATGVAAGEFLINSYDRSGKTALLVAGYNAADTEKAVTYLLNNDVDTTVGTKIKGTSATEATVVTA